MVKEQFEILLTENSKRVVVYLDIYRTLDDNLMINDHPYFTIVISDKLNKIMTFPKAEKIELSFDRQRKFFDYLVTKGVVSHGSVQGGLVHLSLEGKLPHNLDVNSMQVALICIYDFFRKEKDHELKSYRQQKEFEKSMLDPNENDSTELGEVPHEDEKGSIPRTPHAIGTGWYGAYSGYSGYSRIY